MYAEEFIIMIWAGSNCINNAGFSGVCRPHWISKSGLGIKVNSVRQVKR